jgi:hypothetical protein
MIKKILLFAALAMIAASSHAGYPWVYQQQLTASDLNAAFAARCTFSTGSLTQYQLIVGNGVGDIAPIGTFGTTGQALISTGTSSKPNFAPITTALIVGGITVQTGTTYTVTSTDDTMIANAGASITYTLPTPSTYTGRTLTINSNMAFTVVSASSNVIPITGGSAGTAILSATAGKWADLKSDGTYWRIIRGN